jgi:hypothetical protein
MPMSPVYASLALLIGASIVGCVTSTSNGSADGGPGVGFDSGTPDADAGFAPANDSGGDSADGAASAACPVLTGAGTPESGTITKDTIWTAASSPHVISFDMSVAAGATLTLEPCAVVQITGFYGITVSGKIVAPGTAANPISIVGTDAQKPFGCIQTASGGSLDFANVTLKNGGNVANTFYPAPIQIRGDGSTLQPLFRAKNVTIDGSQQYGLVLKSGGQMSPDSAGLVIKNAAFGPVSAEANVAGSISLGTYTGNAKDEILVLGNTALGADMTLKNVGVPYRVGDAQGNGTELRIGVAPTATTPAQHAVLTLEAGVTLRVSPQGRVSVSSDANGAALGAIVANGTAAQPVVFTSAAATPAPGDWVGLYLAGIPDAADKLDFVHVEFAGGPSLAKSFHCDANGTLNEAEDAAILILGGQPASAFVTNSTISSSAAYGIDRGWTGGLVDFTATNTFTANAKCSQSYPRETGGGCPATVTCP